LAGFQLLDERRLGLLDLGDGCLADADQGFDGLGACPHVFGAELDRMLDVEALDGLLDQLGANVRSHSAGGAIDPPGAEEIRVALAVAAGADAVGQAGAALAAKDRASQIRPVTARVFGGDLLFVQ
jgi:hypothetical protein